MVVRRLAGPAVLLAEIMVLGRVGVAGEADGVFAAFEELEERLLVRRVLVGLRPEEGADRNMHDRDDQRVARRLREQVAYEGKLLVVEPALIVASTRLCRVGAEVVDVVEHEEQRRAIEKGAIVGAIDALERFAAQGAIGRLEIEVVVAADGPPR